jgi:homoserine dehydrogenase
MANRKLRLCLIGFGNVGRAFAELLLREHDRLQSETGLDFVVTGICTARFGAVADPGSIDLRQALERSNAGSAHGPFEESTTFAARCPADIVVETTPLEPFTGALGIAIIRAALTAGRSVASANKGPVAHNLRSMRELASQHGVRYRYESAVADGMPVFSLIERTLPCANVTAVTGLLNSTSGVVLEALSEGRNVAEGFERAKALGIVEDDDATYDLDGWDAAIKLCALSAGIWDKPIHVEDVERELVSEELSATAVDARGRGNRLVSMATLQLSLPDDVVRAKVEVVEIGPDSVFFALTGTSLGFRVETSLLQPITVSCSDPQLADTAYGLLADVLHIALDESSRT